MERARMMAKSRRVTNEIYPVFVPSLLLALPPAITIDRM